MDFGELLKVFLLDLQSMFRYRVSSSDLTLPQILIISSISHEGTDMSSLSKQMGVDNSTMTRLIAVLIRNEWVAKYKSTNDRRVVFVRLPRREKLYGKKLIKKLAFLVKKLLMLSHPKNEMK